MPCSMTDYDFRPVRRSYNRHSSPKLLHTIHLRKKAYEHAFGRRTLRWFRRAGCRKGIDLVEEQDAWSEPTSF
jgi:hypothetical protein